MPILSVIILNFNTKDITTLCVSSFLKHYKRQVASQEFEIILFDNGSCDESVIAFKNYKEKQDHAIKDQIAIISNSENLGFSKGCNRAATHAKGEFLLFLNSDTEVLNGQLISMIEFLKNASSVGIVGGTVVQKDGKVKQSAGKFLTIPTTIRMLFGNLNAAGFSPKTIQQVEWVEGSVFLVKKNVFETLKGFDEYFFMYVEDMEFCFRALQLGYLTFFYPEFRVLHRELGSSSRAFAIFHIYKGIVYFFQKHKTKAEYYIMRKLLLLKAIIAFMLGVVSANAQLRKTYLEALKTL